MADKEYIERGAVLKTTPFTKYGGDLSDAYTEGYLDCAEEARMAVKCAPAADVVEVRHGEWKLIETEGFCDGGFYSRFCCPLCFREIGVCHDYEKDAYNYAKTMYPYCHCGARMDGERKEQT